MNTSPIEWTEVTWNPATGCDQISPGCDNCYALRLAARLKAMGAAKYQTNGDPRTSGPGFGVTWHEDTVGDPLTWRKPRTVFVNSMSDVGHARLPATFVAKIWAVMAATPRHTYQVLTKRPGRLARLLGEAAPASRGHKEDRWFTSLVEQETRALGHEVRLGGTGADRWPLPNVWVGTSIETDAYVGRADDLRGLPAVTRFLSLEPLLGPLPSLDLTGIDWVIAGGESGPGHRTVDLGWVRDIRDRCLDAKVAFFFKQVGGPTPKAGGRELDGRTWDQMPARRAGAYP